MRARTVSPMRCARSTRPSSSNTSSTATAAASATGLPTYVPPTALSQSESMISALPTTPESGSPPAIDFATRHQVGLDAVVLDREHPPGAAEAGLHLVDDEEDPLAVADRAQPLHELRRRGDEAALALHRLDDDRGDRLGGDLRRERALERVERVAPADPAVLVRERDAVDLGRERPEPRLVGMRLRGEREREERAPVEPALEGDHRRPARVAARELDGVLDGLGARVEERGLGRAGERSERRQPLGVLDVDLVRDDREVGVEEARGLLLHRGDDARVGVADGEAADAAGEVDEAVAVDVGDDRAVALRDHDRQVEPERVGDHRLLALGDLAGAGARDLGTKLDCARDGHEARVSAAPDGESG